MPFFLRYDTIRLLEASLEALHLAVSSLGTKKRNNFRQETAEFSIEIGLIGSAAELAMSAMLVQKDGPDAIMWPSGQYKTAGAVLDEFRAMVSTAAPVTDFLTRDLPDPPKHRQDLLDLTIQFRRLIPVRGAGLHAGRGLLHEATVYQASIVGDFLELLGKSSRIKPYIEKVPRCTCYKDERTLLVEDITRRIHSGVGDQASNLASIYLVLPDIPANEPDWLSSFERLTVAPKARDVSYLLDILETALPATLRKTTKPGDFLPVKVENGNPNALPISPQYLRRQFSEICDLWNSDIATANGRIQNNTLDLPTIDTVREVFALGLEKARIVSKGELGPHDTWVHIAASLNARGKGTEGPFWFLVRRTSDLGQLISLLKRAMKLVPATTKKRFDSALKGIEAIKNNTCMLQKNFPYMDLLNEIQYAEIQRKEITQGFERNKCEDRGLPDEFNQRLAAIDQGGEIIGPLLKEILENDELKIEARKYWAGLLSRFCLDLADLPALIMILAEEKFSSAHTEARKAIRRIDFRIHGPPLCEETIKLEDLL